ncbi:hypothetical protein CIG75_19095 [Tumebacillus algifaecis]|uniref:Uncharacterized protein n=1 Tax=Tumebacillus algifaecis TaxID=1214604 RepID=A0A223D5R3_9BACL|nr:hypothetical protein [Tumebacillus algifaecis]ASS76840.1 hypothetical protein CIG75_19095 [Tumebacillus algifaecis]
MNTHTTKGFSIVEPDEEHANCSFCKLGIPHTVIEIQTEGGWLSIPTCAQCQTVMTITLARDIATDAGYEDTPQGLAEFVSTLDWEGREPVEGRDMPEEREDGRSR